jgi:ComF family protein
MGARFWERALDLVFPQRCVGCSEFGSPICERCAGTMTAAEPPRCDVCWTPRDHQNVCRDCRTKRPAFQQLRSAFVYEGVARDAVIALKFGGLSSIAPLMAGLIDEQLSDWGPPVNAIVPVPLASGRKRSRGYDQAEMIAKELSKRWGLPCESRALKRARGTAPQVEQADESARRRNVKDAFSPGSRGVEGGVLLVDDVVTTGATLDACTNVLMESGAGDVFALTFARED